MSASQRDCDGAAGAGSGFFVVTFSSAALAPSAAASASAFRAASSARAFACAACLSRAACSAFSLRRSFAARLAASASALSFANAAASALAFASAVAFASGFASTPSSSSASAGRLVFISWASCFSTASLRPAWNPSASRSRSCMPTVLLAQRGASFVYSEMAAFSTASGSLGFRCRSGRLSAHSYRSEASVAGLIFIMM